MSLQSCLKFCDPVDCSPPDSSVHGILQARVLEWVAMPSSRGSSWPRNLSLLCLQHWQVGSLPLVPHWKPCISFCVTKLPKVKWVSRIYEYWNSHKVISFLPFSFSLSPFLLPLPFSSARFFLPLALFWVSLLRRAIRKFPSFPWESWHSSQCWNHPGSKMLY